MMHVAFGTDGIRGKFGSFPITEEVFNCLGQACCDRLMREKLPLRVVIGWDTRASGPQLARAFAEGFCSWSVEAQVCFLGITPTPAISFYTQSEQISLGVSITASHNPFTDNGLKLFKMSGCKLRREEEMLIENLLEGKQSQKCTIRGQSFSGSDYYLRSFKALKASMNLKGERIVLDTANGATTYTTLPLLKDLGADVIALGDKPDGRNINYMCGSEHADRLQSIVKDQRAWLGFAHDGDGDRLVVIDEKGERLDGDELLGMLALELQQQKLLENSLLVVTEQSNSGLSKTLNLVGIEVVTCGVGDREVFYKLEENGGVLGGENSGHIILKNEVPTGDGLRILLKLLQMAKKIPLCERKKSISLLPKLESSLVVEKRIPLECMVYLKEVKNHLSKEVGRIHMRYSGTENKLRFLVEAPTQDLCEERMKLLKQAVKSDLQ